MNEMSLTNLTNYMTKTHTEAYINVIYLEINICMYTIELLGIQFPTTQLHTICLCICLPNCNLSNLSNSNSSLCSCVSLRSPESLYR